MAVSDPNANITPAYGQVIDQLKNRASLELQRPSIMDAGTKIADTARKEIDNLNEQKFQTAKLYIQHSFDTELAKQQQDFQKRGDVTIDDDHIKQMQDTFGIDLTPYKGLAVNADKMGGIMDEAQKRFTSKKIQDVWDDQKLAPDQKRIKVQQLLIQEGSKGASAKAADAMFSNKAQKPIVYPDSTSSSGYRYAQPDSAGKYVKSPDDLEAPASAAQGRGGSGGNAEGNRLASIAKDYDKQINPLDAKLQAHERAIKLLDDPKGKGFGQNVALLNVVRDAIGSASRINQIELQRLTGLPDIGNRLERAGKRLTDGEALSNEDKVAVKTVLDLSKTDLQTERDKTEQRLIARGKTLAPSYSDEQIKSALMGGTAPAVQVITKTATDKNGKKFNVEVDASGKITKVLGPAD